VLVVLEDGTELEKTVSFADKMLAIPGGLANFVQSLPEHVLDATGTITTHREVVLAFLGQRIGVEVEKPDRIVSWYNPN